MEWLKSYLTNRIHRVNLSDCLFQVEVIVFCVPQGAVLTPLIFLYINYLPLCCEQVDPYMLMTTDDSSLPDESNFLITYALNDELNQIFQNSCSEAIEKNCHKSKFASLL